MAPDTAQPLYVALAWIERHDVVPDGPRRGEPFHLYAYQGQYLLAFYLVRPTASVGQLATAFVHRRGLIVGPQGIGKNPLIAAQTTLEGIGPALFAGWAGKDDGYACSDHGCGCGFAFPYKLGEPMGRAWATPLIQVTAFSQDSTDNTYDALRPMIELGPLADLIPKTGEAFIRLPNGGRIDTVTSSDRSRLGQRVTFVPQDEVGLYTPSTGMVRLADTQYRNLAKMGGRASLTTNAYDPAQHSIAQREFESAATDVYRQFREPPKNLSFTDKRERRKILHFVYDPDTRTENGGHVDLDSIEAEAADLVTKDPAQAERFFGNRRVQSAGRAFDLERWQELAISTPKTVPDGALIVLGFDGSRLHDNTALVATEVASGYQWPLGIWRPEDHHGSIPADLVTASVASAFARWDVWRLYGDPPFWDETLAAWAGRWGKDRVIEWWTNRPKAMAYALRTWSDAMRTGEISHCAQSDAFCATFSEQVGNAIRRETGYRDDGGILYLIEKPHQLLKIDTDMAAALSWEARSDAIAAGALNVKASSEPLVAWAG